MKLLINTLTALILAAAFATAADEGKKPEGKGGERPKMNPEEAFKKLDKDNDSALTLEEFKASPRFSKDASKAEEIFKAKDKDGNGKLSLEEFKAHGPKPEGKKEEKKDK